jgi:hypothetical protein
MEESSHSSEFRAGVIRINCAQESVDILGGPWEVKQEKKKETKKPKPQLLNVRARVF